jgi:glycosyltransferase involved in cell wall biosynthesis
VQGILKLDRTNQYTVYVKKVLPKAPAFPGTHWSIKALDSKYLWLTGGKAMDRTLDLYIFFTPIIPLFFRPKKSIVLALDFAYLDILPRTFKDWLSTRLLYLIQRRSLRLATKVVAISHYTKERTMHHFGISEDKIQLVHIGFIQPSAQKQEMDVPEHFFLFAGALKERKNVVGVIRAFAASFPFNKEFFLLIAGTKRGPYYESLVALAMELGIHERVRFLGYVTNEELAYLYAKATALVFPSFIEGFGMPVLEAMSVGLPVITSNQGALAEVAGDAALRVDPGDASAIARAMTLLATTPGKREEMRKKGFIQASKFTWEDTAAKFLNIVHNRGV